MTRGSSGPAAAPLAIVGPTASGKTALSIPVAEALGAEIVNIDSTLVFRGMDAWTGKPTAEDRRRVRHHLLDEVDPVGPFSVAEFQRRAGRALDDIRSRGLPALLVGGSGLYYRAVVDGLEFPPTDPATRAALDREASGGGGERLYRRLAELDPSAARKIEPANVRRTVRALEVLAVTGRRFSDFAAAWERFEPERVRAAGLEVPREVLHERIDRRAHDGLSALLAETRVLLERGSGPFLRTAHVIGYAEAAACLDGKLSEDEAVARIARRDRELARRQRAWFRRDPRIRWFEAGGDDPGDLVGAVASYLGGALAQVGAEA
jgi:tRNA dimethylallyltransferase